MDQKQTYEELKQRVKELEKLETERKRAEEALRESERQYRLLVKNLPSIVYKGYKDWSVNFFDRKIEKLTGYNFDVFNFKKMKWSDLIIEEDIKAARESFIQALKTDKSYVREYRIKSKAGDLRWIQERGQIVCDSKGEVEYVSGVFFDITRTKEMEARLQHAQKMESVGTLAGGVAHNFNNLLMGIIGYTSLMLDEIDEGHDNYTGLKNIEELVNSGSKLTRKLLGYAREGKYEIRSLNLNYLIKSTSDNVGITKQEIRVHLDLAEDLLAIKADQGQIEQALLDLYFNAADAMAEGGDLYLKTMNVTVKDMTDKLYKPKPGNWVLLTIRDTGAGMDKETMTRIFEPFFTTKRLAEGTGLGLTSVYDTIKGHGGYIDVSSEKDNGTTFSIYLPPAEEKVKGEKEHLYELKKGNGIILFVDDEDMVLNVGEKMLIKMGYNVLSSNNGHEALNLYRENQGKIDMVILDMVMPDMGGGETYDRLKEINPDIKVLLSSGYSINGQATEILKRGCNSFIQKPVNMIDLSQKIREILDKK